MFSRGTPTFAAFDLLWLNREDLRDLPCWERKAMLRELVPNAGGRLLYVDYVEGRGE